MFLQHQSSLFRGRYYNGQCLLLKCSQKVILSLNLQTVCLVLSSSIHLLFLLFSGLTPTCSLNSLPDEVILQIFSRVSLRQVLCTIKHKSEKFLQVKPLFFIMEDFWPWHVVYKTVLWKHHYSTCSTFQGFNKTQLFKRFEERDRSGIYVNQLQQICPFLGHFLSNMPPTFNTKLF